MRLLNTLYVTDHRYRVSVSKGALEVRVAGELVARVPMAGLDGVILVGAADMTMQSLGQCVQRGISVASVHTSGRLRFVVHGSTSGNVLLRLSQYRIATNTTASIHLAKRFVSAKLQNQRHLMRRWRDGVDGEHVRRLTEVIADRIRALPSASDGDTLRGLEGDASRRYFKALGAHLGSVAPPFTFMSRSRRPPRDPVNAILSYLYSLLTIDAVGSLEAVGLDPQVGFLHQPRPGRPSLALDLVEEFRAPFAERFAVRVLRRREISPEMFVRVGDAYYLSDDGRKALLARWEEFRSEEVDHPLLERPVSRSLVPKVQATLLARYLRGDLSDYPPFVCR